MEFCNIAEKLKVLVEDLSPEEVEELQQASSQHSDKAQKIKQVLKDDGWEAQGFLYKDGITTFARKGNLNVSIKTAGDAVVDITIEGGLKKISVEDLQAIVISLQGLLEALK